jgi:hypothetical protein
MAGVSSAGGNAGPFCFPLNHNLVLNLNLPAAAKPIED